jgi:hypothetical protein
MRKIQAKDQKIRIFALNKITLAQLLFFFALLDKDFTEVSLFEIIDKCNRPFYKAIL